MHLEDRDTFVLHNVADDLTVGAICELYVKSADPKGIKKLFSSDLQAFTAKGRPLDSNQSLKKAIGKDSDVYLQRTAGPLQLANKGLEDYTEVSLTPNIKEDADLWTDSKQQASTSSGEEGACKGESPLIAPLLQQAIEKESLQHYKAAAFIYKQVLDYPESQILHWSFFASQF